MGRDESACIKCGGCVEASSYLVVHTKSGGYLRRPRSYLCLGFACREKEFFCVAKCPAKALRLSIHPVYGTLGDRRWPADLLLSTWWQAEWGNSPIPTSNIGWGTPAAASIKCVFSFPNTVRTSS